MENFKILMKEPTPTPLSRHRHLVSSGILVVITLLAFVVGVLYGRNQGAASLGASAFSSSSVNIIGIGADASQKIKDVNFNLYWDVWNKLQEKFIGKPIKDENLFYGSLEGLVAATGDPYTVFLKPQKAERFNQDLSGSFFGIGAELGMKKDFITIVAPLPDSPAERAGLKSGDKILAVDGKETYGWSLDEAVNKIRGPKGTEVKLLILSNNSSTPKEVKIIRDVIKVKSVIWEMKEGGVAYIKISSFNEDTSSAFDKSVREVLVKNPSSLILDLRNNPGGFLDVAVRVASEWIPEGAIVEEKFSDGHSEKYVSSGKHRLKDLKTWVLVNGGSASASEIVAGALQDYGKAVLVGEKTFGKGSVQDYEQLSDGSALKITVAEWLTPKGRHINNNGIEPDKKMAPVITSATSTPVAEEEIAPVKDTVLENAVKGIR